MSITLGANILSQRVQRRLATATSEVTATSERLSSGQRINRAADDAAGLSISASLQVGARVFSQGIRNLNDGLSAVNIAEGAISELTTIAARIEELASQAANGTFSDTQRTSLQSEVSALQSEWNRIVDSTSFNGASLLTGSNTSMVLQGGRGTDGTLTVQVGEQALGNGFNNYAGGTTRTTVTNAGVQSSSNSTVPSISADGGVVSFATTGSNLVSGDSNGVEDVLARNIATGLFTVASSSSSGTFGNGASTAPNISADGKFVAYQSDATNLVSGDSNGATDVFVKNLETGATTRVSTSSAGVEGNGTSRVAAISADGRYVAFESTASNLVSNDTNGASDIFVKDTITGTTTLVSVSSLGAQGDGASVEASISASGRYVAFESVATNLVSGDTNARRDIFVRDLFTGTTTRVSTSSDGSQGSGHSYAPSISGDGQYVAFHSVSNLVGGEGADRDVYVKNRSTGGTAWVSKTESGAASNSFSLNPAISADGRFVAFYSFASNIVSGDTNGQSDVFMRDLENDSVVRISTTTAGVGANDRAYNPTISADGRYVAFQSTATNLVSGDTNGAWDIFLRDLRTAGVQEMAGMVVSNQASARLTMDLIQGYREELANYLSKLGSQSSRISTFTSALNSSQLNYREANSRIVDADVASEVSRLLAQSISQNIATSLAAEANQLPRIVVDLIRNS